jgi:hypothetical protein
VVLWSRVIRFSFHLHYEKMFWRRFIKVTWVLREVNNVLVN